MHSAGASRASTTSASAKPGAVTTLLQAVLGDRPLQRSRARGRRRRTRRAARRSAARGERDRGDAERRLLLGDQAPGEQHERRARRGVRRHGSRRPGVEAAQHRHRPAQPLLAQARGVQLGEAERALADARAEALHERADAPAGAAEVVAPVVRGSRPRTSRRPARSACSGRSERGGEQREVGERAGVHDVVAAAVAQQVREHAEPEDERRQDPPAPARPCRAPCAVRPRRRARARRGSSCVPRSHWRSVR